MTKEKLCALVDRLNALIDEYGDVVDGTLAILEKLEPKPFDLLAALLNGETVNRLDSPNVSFTIGNDGALWAYNTRTPSTSPYHIHFSALCSGPWQVCARQPIKGSEEWACAMLKSGARIVRESGGDEIYINPSKTKGQVGYIQTDDDYFHASDISGDGWKLYITLSTAAGAKRWDKQQE